MQENSAGSSQSQMEAILKNNPLTKRGSHGLTPLELSEIKEQQSFDDEPLFIQANCSPDYQIRDYEKHMIHCLVERERFDSSTGKRLSVPLMQKFYVDDFVKMSNVTRTKDNNGSIKNPENAFRGKKVTLIHDPRKKTTDKAQKISEMNIEDLRETYRSVYGNEPDAEDTADTLTKLIAEKLQSSKTQKSAKPISVKK
jgi:hypothetical protein